jgi:hypothetical protein
MTRVLLLLLLVALLPACDGGEVLVVSAHCYEYSSYAVVRLNGGVQPITQRWLLSSDACSHALTGHYCSFRDMRDGVYWSVACR